MLSSVTREQAHRHALESQGAVPATSCDIGIEQAYLCSLVDLRIAGSTDSHASSLKTLLFNLLTSKD
jgi:hypothetical protein